MRTSTRRPRAAWRAVLLATTALALVAAGLPQQDGDGAGRVFPEPADSTDFITRGPEYAPEQFKEGMLELQRRPRVTCSSRGSARRWTSRWP